MDGGLALTGLHYWHEGDMDLDVVIIAVGMIGFAATLAWMLAG